MTVYIHEVPIIIATAFIMLLKPQRLTSMISVYNLLRINNPLVQD